jgi:hypothetical protein
VNIGLAFFIVPVNVTFQYFTERKKKKQPAENSDSNKADI